ncbi:MAG: hypothetical protein NZ583_03130 [Desulfobacterota bacterium]|nr:hypothetical protein [Thermodesulfobacteriota bacterium]MDW8001880.1 hypothetical protein [Deltaproteobacteria bacterium]
MEHYDIFAMDKKIQEIKEAVKELERLGEGIEAVKRNLVRLKATLKMLELNISDVKLVYPS